MVNRHPRGILDTSVIIDFDGLSPGLLPVESAISVLTLAELSAGPHAATTPEERARRQELLQRVEASLEAIPLSTAAARAFGQIYAVVAAAGRKARGARSIDLLIAATASAEGLPLYTRNPTDFRGLEPLVTVVAV